MIKMLLATPTKTLRRPPDTPNYPTQFYNWRYSTTAGSTYSLSGGNAQGARISPEFTWNKASEYGLGYGTSGGTGYNGYYIDENTFGTKGGWRPGGAAPHQFGYWASSANRTTWANGGITIAHFNDNTGMNTEGAVLDNTRFAGLCAACHNFTALSTAWGGHVVVPGVTGAWTNMFNRPYMMQLQTVGRGMSGIGKGDNWGQIDADMTGYTTGNDSGYKWGYSPIDNASAQSGYHKFPCSKCHTPHASILPRLMTSNCLDIGSGKTTIKNSAYAYPTGGLAWNTLTLGLQGLPTSYTGTNDAWALSVTCHADTDQAGNDTPIEGTAPGTPAANTFNGAKGWNRVTPW